MISVQNPVNKTKYINTASKNTALLLYNRVSANEVMLIKANHGRRILVMGREQCFLWCWADNALQTCVGECLDYTKQQIFNDSETKKKIFSATESPNSFILYLRYLSILEKITRDPI